MKKNKLKNKVCVLTSGHEAFDIRIFYKECKSLFEAGYQVYLVAGSERDAAVDGINIVSVKPGRSRAYRFFVKGLSVLFKAIKLNADIIHFHDPDLIPAGLILKLLGKKVIYDVHEDVPKDILSKEWIGSPVIRRFVSLLFKSFLNFACLFFDGIIAATPGISKGFPTDKTIVLRNVPYVSFIENIEPSPLIKTGFSVIYAGGLSEIRGIRQLIEAAGLLDDSLELWLMGGWEDPVYEKQCAQLAGWKRVRYFGEKTLEDTYSIMKRADIGIVNFLPVPNSVQSLPNKVFEYLACKLPVVMSNFDYWKELFGECAVFADPFDPVSIAKKIRTLLDDRELRMKLVRAGAVLIENEYSWESESKSLIDLYKRLTGGNSSETDNGAGEQAAVY